MLSRRQHMQHTRLPSQLHMDNVNPSSLAGASLHRSRALARELEADGISS